MEEFELKHICSNKNIKKGNSIWLYWSSELYSFGKYIRKYGYYPSFFPLAVYSDHSGPSFSDIPYKHEEESRAPVFLAHRKIKVQNYKKITNKKAYTLFSPQVFYRRSYNIKKSDNAKGTLALPIHSLPNAGFEFDVTKYCNELKALPEKYHPVRVSLHMHDINNDTFKEYQKNGIEVVTAGNTSDQRFIERLYALLKETNYVTSNDISTITFLAVEMRIPFFLYGEEEKTINISDKNFKKGVIEKPLHKQYLYLKEKLVLDENLDTYIYDEKLIKSVESALGLHDGISRLKMAIVLYKSLILWVFTFEFVFWFKEKMKK